jgi:hypothetical protein
MNDLTGQIFSRLTVVEQAESKHNRTRWLCLCECGKTCITAGKNLTDKKKQSCGCLRRELVGARQYLLTEINRGVPGESAFNVLYATYKFNAEKRSRVFELTKEEFRRLTSSACEYCGAEPKQKVGTERNGFYVYNGVDRKDNGLGYTNQNSASCCGTCNWMKRVMSIEKFVSACRSVVAYCDSHAVQQ